MSSFVGAIAIADLVKTTLGPKGQDKILQSMGNGSITITNDGATILGSITVDNPAAKVLINIAKTQDDEVGDGTTRCGWRWLWRGSGGKGAAGRARSCWWHGGALLIAPLRLPLLRPPDGLTTGLTVAAVAVLVPVAS
jgi:hypothetical protein